MTLGPTVSLSAQQLACTRGDRVLFAGLDLAVVPGQSLWLRGRNGVGKTSLLRLLAGLAVPADGVVRWRGQDIRRQRGDFQRELLWLGHAPGLKDDLSALENLQFTARVQGVNPTRAALREALARLGLAREQRLPAGLLSQGQRRRVALARLFLDPVPALWLLDEPYTALDDVAVAEVTDRLSAHLAAGGLLVYTTHQPQTLGAAAPPLTLELDRCAVPTKGWPTALRPDAGPAWGAGGPPC